MHIYYKQYLSFPGLGNRGCFRSKITTPSTIIGPSDILVCADEYLRTCSITYHKGAFINHVDIAGGGGSFYQMSILINCQKGGMGVKNVQKSVHNMVYEWPHIRNVIHDTHCKSSKMRVDNTFFIALRWNFGSLPFFTHGHKRVVKIFTFNRSSDHVLTPWCL